MFYTLSAIGYTLMLLTMLKLQTLDDGGDWGEDYGDSYWGNGGAAPMGRLKPGMRGGYNEEEEYVEGPRHVVHMRGLPYRAIEDDIAMVRISNSFRKIKMHTLIIWHFETVFQTFRAS